MNAEATSHGNIVSLDLHGQQELAAEQWGHLSHMIRAEWFRFPEKSRCRIQVNRAFKVSLPTGRVPPIHFDSDDIRVGFAFADIPYLAMDSIRLEQEGSRAAWDKVQIGWVIRKTGPGCVSLLSTPSIGDGVTLPDESVAARIDLARALVTMKLGRNACFTPLFEVDIDAAGPSSSSSLLQGETPLFHPVPDLSLRAFTELQALMNHVLRQSVQVRGKLLTALAWFGEAQGTYGPHGLVRRWTALESLAGERGVEHRTIQALKEIHVSLSKEQIRQCFPIRDAHRIRNKIVHEGQVFPPLSKHGGIMIGFLEDAFTDVLLFQLGKPTDGRTHKYLDGRARIAASALRLELGPPIKG